MASTMRRAIEVQVFPRFRAQAQPRWVRSVAEAALDIADPGSSSALSVVIADDETVRDLNNRFRGVDEVTDVLAFGATSENAPTPPDAAFPPLPGEESLGEVVISQPQAARQAPANGATVERETALLIVHGVLHLLGHEHAEPEEAAAMRRLEEQALGAISSERTDART